MKSGEHQQQLNKNINNHSNGNGYGNVDGKKLPRNENKNNWVQSMLRVPIENDFFVLTEWPCQPWSFACADAGCHGYNVNDKQ